MKYSTFDCLIVERRGPVGWLINNRPDRLNAMSSQMRDEFAIAWKELDADPDVRVIVHTGEGRAFQTGVDVTEIATDGLGMQRYHDSVVNFDLHFTSWHQQVWKPVITAINGICAGGGFHWVADADIVIAASDAQFFDPHVSVGQVVSIEAIGLLRKMPVEAVMRMAFVGRHERLSAARAYELGMISQVVDPPERLRAEAQALAEKIAQNSPAAMRATKRALWGALEMGLTDACRAGAGELVSMWGHPDQVEGPLAFAERREPRWHTEVDGTGGLTMTVGAIDGWTAEGFEGVRTAFEKNFAEGLEVGAAFAAYHRGRLVADLWGGIADVKTQRPWERDTLIPVFSTTKGFTAICANKLAQEGLLDIDAPVAQYWPEFAQAGKDDMPVRYLFTHQAGLAWVDEPLTLEQALAWEPMIHALERQKPSWVPGTAHGYHAITFGYLVGEVVRRITGRSIGTYFHEEIAEPLGLDCWIGLPEEEESRVAMLVGSLTGGLESADLDAEARAAIAALMGPDSVMGKALGGGGAFSGEGIWNTRAVHAAEVPAAAGVSDARSIARLYAACIGDVDGIRILTPERVKLASTQETEGPNTVLMGLDIQFGLGFFLPSTIVQVGGPNSFGHFGAGGSVGWADPDAEFGFGYVMSKMDMGLAGDQRSSRLIDACYAAVS